MSRRDISIWKPPLDRWKEVFSEIENKLFINTFHCDRSKLTIEKLVWNTYKLELSKFGKIGFTLFNKSYLYTPQCARSGRESAIGSQIRSSFEKKKTTKNKISEIKTSKKEAKIGRAEHFIPYTIRK